MEEREREEKSLNLKKPREKKKKKKKKKTNPPTDTSRLLRKERLRQTAWATNPLQRACGLGSDVKKSIGEVLISSAWKVSS